MGIPRDSVTLCPYSEEWKLYFEKEKANLYNCTKEYLVDIQHVGSTSIIDMPSKLIIDIAVAIIDLNRSFQLIDDIKSISYHFKGSLGMNNRFFFWKCNDGINTHNLHIVEYGDKN
ncbi:GrpB family protein [Clostridium sp. Marseille-QA1073]